MSPNSYCNTVDTEYLPSPSLEHPVGHGLVDVPGGVTHQDVIRGLLDQDGAGRGGKHDGGVIDALES